MWKCGMQFALSCSRKLSPAAKEMVCILLPCQTEPQARGDWIVPSSNYAYSKYVESKFRACIDTIGFVQTTRPYKRLTDLMLAWHFKTNSKIDKWQPHAVKFSDNFKFLQSLSTSQFSLWVSVRFFVTRVLESDSTEVQVSLQNG